MNTLLNTLPTDVIDTVRSRLGAYSAVYVWANDIKGTYRVQAHIGLSNTNDNWSYVATFNSDEVLTLNERIIAYIKNFKDFPFCAGKSRFTYKLTREERKALQSNWTAVKFNDEGKIVFI